MLENKRYKTFLPEVCPIKKISRQLGLPDCKDKCQQTDSLNICAYSGDGKNNIGFRKIEFTPTNDANPFINRFLGRKYVIIYETVENPKYHSDEAIVEWNENIII